jgi:hypothetical protein
MPPVSVQGAAIPSKEREDNLLFLTPVESRRLSVTAGGASSFRRLGGAGVIVGASPPSGPPGAVSPALSRIQSSEGNPGAGPGGPGPHRGLQVPLPPALEEAVASGDSGKASNDSINSNADISIHAVPNRAGWRRERPAPLQLSGGGGAALPGGIGEPAMSSDGGAGGVHPAVGLAFSDATLAAGATSMRNIRSAMRRSATHDHLMQPSFRTMMPVGGAVIVSGGGPPAGPDASHLDEEEEEEEEDDGVGRGLTLGGAVGGGASRGPRTGEQPGGGVSVRHAITDVERVRRDRDAGKQSQEDYYQGAGQTYASAQPLVQFQRPSEVGGSAVDLEVRRRAGRGAFEWR